MITLLQGTPGSGKSSVMVTDMAEHLLSGGWIATNFSLVPNWLDILCNYSLKYRYFMDEGQRQLYRDSLSRRAWQVGTPDTVETLGKVMRSSVPRVREGMGKLFLDEAQFLFNSRNWQQNSGFIEFFTQHRKLGWDVVLIAHTKDMIDKQIRGLIELETRIRNLQKIKLFGMVPCAWKPTFLCITRYAGVAAGAGEIFSKRLYPLHRTFSQLYDTMEVFAFNAAKVDCRQHSELAIIPRKKNPIDFREVPYYETITAQALSYQTSAP